MRIKDIPANLRPREKAMSYGIESLDDRELLALFIRTGTKQKSAIDLADQVLFQIRGLSYLPNVKMADIMSISGIKKAKALELVGIFEICKRMMKPSQDLALAVYENETLMQWLNTEIGYQNQEHFLVVYLSNQNHILHYRILFKGTVDSSLVHPRDIFREAVAYNATRVLLVHNHPGKTLVPSVSDIHTTKILYDAGTMLGIQVVDHVIVSFGDYISLRESHSYIFEE